MAPPPITPSPRRFLPSKAWKHPSNTLQTLPSSTSQQFAPTPRFASARATSKAKDPISDDRQIGSVSSPLLPSTRPRSTPRRASGENIDDDNDDVPNKETKEGREQNGKQRHPTRLTSASKALQDAMQIDPPASEDASSELEELMLPPPKRRRLTPSPPPQQRTVKASLSNHTAQDSLNTFAPTTLSTPPRNRPIIISSSPRTPRSPSPSPNSSPNAMSPITPHTSNRSRQPATAPRFRLSPTSSSKVPNQQRSAFKLPPSDHDHASGYDPSLVALLFSPHRSRRGRPSHGGTGGRKYEYMPDGMAATVRDWVVGMSHVPRAGRERVERTMTVKSIGKRERGGRPIKGTLMSEDRGGGKVEKDEKWLLIGELTEADGRGMEGKTEAGVKLEEGAMVAAKEPSWEVEIEGEVWRVVLRWEVVGRRQQQG